MQWQLLVPFTLEILHNWKKKSNSKTIAGTDRKSLTKYLKVKKEGVSENKCSAAPILPTPSPRRWGRGEVRCFWLLLTVQQLNSHHKPVVFGATCLVWGWGSLLAPQAAGCGHTAASSISSQEQDLWDFFSFFWGSDFDLCIHPASIRLNPLSLPAQTWWASRQIYGQRPPSYFQHVIHYRLLQIADQMAARAVVIMIEKYPKPNINFPTESFTTLFIPW